MADILDSLEKLIGVTISEQINEAYHPYTVSSLQSYATRLGKVSGRPDFKYTAYAVPGDVINAFSAPGGYIYVYDGIIKKFNKDIISGVVGHEITHIARRHCINSLIASYGLDYISGLINQGKDRQIFDAVTTIITRGFGREAEFEADRYSVIYNNNAGLYPFGIKHFMEWLVSVEQQPTDSIKQKLYQLLATHPPATERLTKINNTIAELGITEKAIKPEINPYWLPIGLGLSVLAGGLAYTKFKK